MEIRLNGCLTTCCPKQLLRKIINCSIVHRFALPVTTPAQWPGDSRNHHVLRALVLSCKIFCIYDSFTAIWLFDVIVMVFLLFMIIFAIILAKKRDIKLKYWQKLSFFSFVNLWNLFVANQKIFELNKFLVPTPNTMNGLPCDDISLEKFWIWKALLFQIY